MSKINKLGEYTGIEVSVEKHETTNEEVEAQVQAFLAQNPTMIEKDGEVENGDITTIDFEGFKDGVAFDGGKAEGHVLEIGSGQFIPGFEDQMIGMKKGEERELNLTFPENYASKELAGAAVVFKVTVHKIEQRKAAELNDEYVASLQMPEITTVDGLYKQMRTFIESQHEQEYRTKLENAVFDKLIADSDVEIDEENINTAMEEHINHLRMQVAANGLQLEQYLQMTGFTLDTLKAQLKPAAEQQAKFEAIIDAIVAAEGFTTTDEEVQQQIEIIAKQNQVSVDKVLEQVNKDNLKRDYNRFKASQHVISNAKIA